MNFEVDDTITLSVDNIDQAKQIQALAVQQQHDESMKRLAIHKQVAAQARASARNGVII